MLERLCRVKASQAFKSRRHPTTNGISSALFSPKHCSSFQRWQRQQLCVSRLVDYKALELVLRWTLVSVHDPCVLCGASIMMLANATQLQSCLKGSRPSAYSSLSVSNLRVIRSTRASGSRTVRAASADEQNEAATTAHFSNAADPAAAVALSPKRKGQEDGNPFLDPLVRSLLLGVGAGIFCEAAHVLTKALSLAEIGALPTVFSNAAFQAFSPAYMADHAVAIGMWLLLYTVEAAAIMSVISSNPDKPFQELTTQMSGFPMLPRKIFPHAWTPVKEVVAHTLAKYAAVASHDAAALASTDVVAAAVLAAATSGDLADAQAIAAASPQQLVAPQGLSKQLEKTLDDIEATAAGRVRIPEGPIKPKEHLKKQRFPKLPQQEESAKDRRSRRDQELRERKMYLKNFWYAAALSEKVKDKPVGVDILGTRLTLFRDEEGKVVAVDDTCPHRGAPLSEGWTTTDKKSGKKCVVCPYHGWAFDAEGHLRDVPSADRGTWPKRPIIGSYDVEERGGFVWLFYGSKSLPKEERPPIPSTPELLDPKWRSVYGEIEFDAGHWGVFENAIDMAHIHYLHADSFGNAEKPKVMEMQSHRDTWETTCNFRIHNKPMNKMWEWTSVPSVPVEAKAMLPSTSAVNIELAHGVKMITFVNTVPISENRAINRFCLIRNFALNPAFDFMARDNMYKILGEDKVMVDKLAPERLNVEYSLAPDTPQIAFRQLRQEWIDMGYGVPTEKEVPRRGLLPEEC